MAYHGRMLRKGIFAVYKPKGMTSHDVINFLRRRTGERRIGHAGTLDPLAQGVLVVGVGREATKQLGQYEIKEKEYLAEICLGQESSTGDEEGVKKEILPKIIPQQITIEKTLKHFVGRIDQIPPIYSAIKISGRPAYRYARSGKEIKLAARQVEIKKIEIIFYQWPLLKLRIITGPGVYIRALARDLGQSLGTAGYLTALERTRVGEFTKTKAFALDELD